MNDMMDKCSMNQNCVLSQIKIYHLSMCLLIVTEDKSTLKSILKKTTHHMCNKLML